MFKNILAAVAAVAVVMFVFNLIPRSDPPPATVDVAKADKASSPVPIKVSANPAAEAHAHDECARIIAEHLGVQNWGAIPMAKNNSSGNDFYFAWPKGRIGLQTVFGDVPISASCVGTLNPLKLQWVTVNGKDVR